MMNIELQSYLKFGYNLNYNNPNYEVNFSNINKQKYAGADERELIREGGALLLSEFDKTFKAADTYLVPLSGGADSRAILGMLLHHRKASEILTYTFGTPGTYDFDIGNAIAKRYGTNHISFDLTKHEYSEEEFLDTSKRFDYQSPIFLHPPLRKMDEYFSGAKVLSGANAGAVVGSFLPGHPSSSLEDAFLRFCYRGAFTRSIKLQNCDDEEFLPLMSVKPIDPQCLTYDEQVFFNERSVKHLAPHVLIKGFDYLLPFINNEFMDFMLSVDNKYRRNKSLYYKILFFLFPELFEIPLEGKYGMKRNAISSFVGLKSKYIKTRQRLFNNWPQIFPFTTPMINYLEFNQFFRNNERIRYLIKNALVDFGNRKIAPWINLDHVWGAHQSKSVNMADCILLLFSLEIHLKAGLKLD
jgi:hypothetical protein